MNGLHCSSVEVDDPDFIDIDHKIMVGDIGRRLKNLRKKNKMTIATLAHNSHLSGKTIEQLEKCDPKHPDYIPGLLLNPNIQTLSNLANALHTSIVNLVFDENYSGNAWYVEF